MSLRSYSSALPVILSAAIAVSAFFDSRAWAAAQEDPQELINIRFQNDIRLFSVMSAINVAGFDYETPGEEMSSARLDLRKRLADFDPVLKQKLADYYAEHLEQTGGAERSQVAYVSLSLLLGPPPEFELDFSGEELPEDVWQIRDFPELVKDFYRKADVPGLWETYEKQYDRELASYEPIFREVMRQTLRFMRIPPRVFLDRQIVLIPNLLESNGIVNARNQEKLYYIVVGPTDSPSRNRRQLEHEYLHFLLDPLMSKHGASILKFEDLLNVAQAQPHVRSAYQNKFLLVASEALIESLQLRFSAPDEEEAEREMVRLFRRGLILAPYFYRSLEEYEKNEIVSFPVFLEGLLREFNGKSIQKDEEYVLEIENRLREEAEELRLQQAEAEAHNQIVRHFKAANDFLVQKDYESARRELKTILAIDPKHGNAYFYLGQIAFQQGQHEEALQNYRHSAAATDSEPWVRAFSSLRVGRILASRGQYDDARKLFTEVALLEGDLRGAQSEAEKALAMLPPPE